VEYLQQLCQENAVPYQTIEAAQQGQRKDAGRSYCTAWSCWAQCINAENTSSSPRHLEAITLANFLNKAKAGELDGHVVFQLWYDFSSSKASKIIFK
jgi:hypothetical protein